MLCFAIGDAKAAVWGFLGPAMSRLAEETKENKMTE